MKHQLKILTLEDNSADVVLIQRELKKAGIAFSMRTVDRKDEFIHELKEFKPNLILSDHSLPQFNSLDAFKLAKEFDAGISFILVTGTVSEEFAVECMKAGVDDYILKNSLIRLPSAIEKIISKKNILEEKQIIEKLNHELNSAYGEIEEKNKDLTDSIIYAKHIQEALLPERDFILSLFPDSFLTYIPKNIVSGDFYWLAEHENKIIIAVVDCTGHGVPGAFMSMIGLNMLNYIVYAKDITNPDEILFELNISIRKALRQDGEKSLSKNGMDISICTLDKKKDLLLFSGANRPLLYNIDKKLRIIKGDKFSIGGLQPAGIQSYELHKIKLSEIKEIFMFTDGYADQFGGEKKKKMMTKNFVMLLEQIKKFTIRKQEKALLKWLQEWKGNLEQTDDILVLGIKF